MSANSARYAAPRLFGGHSDGVELPRGLTQLAILRGLPDSQLVFDYVDIAYRII